MLVLMDMEISCKGHCEKLSHFLDHVSHTVNNLNILIILRSYVEQVKTMCRVQK